MNTFYFNDASQASYGIYALLCFGFVEKFWNNTSISSNSLGSLISPYVLRDATLLAYNMELPAGEREPTSFPIVLDGTGTAMGLPEEVAVCVTLEGEPPVTPRRRGRLYIGPLANTDMVIPENDGLNPSRPAVAVPDSITEILAYSAGILMEDTNNCWCIRSTTPSENYVPIFTGYVDNAWDTQRRRGPDPTARRVTSNIVG